MNCGYNTKHATVHYNCNDKHATVNCNCQSNIYRAQCVALSNRSALYVSLNRVRPLWLPWHPITIGFAKLVILRTPLNDYLLNPEELFIVPLIFSFFLLSAQKSWTDREVNMLSSLTLHKNHTLRKSNFNQKVLKCMNKTKTKIVQVLLVQLNVE